MIKTYSELITFKTFEERFEYLKVNGKVGETTFGSLRYMNQLFYKRDPEWLRARDIVIARDLGCDLGIEGREIPNGVPIIVHHINPINSYDIANRTRFLLDPEYLITTYKLTHDAIHYSNSDLLIKDPIIRTKNDTCPWKRN